MFPRLLGRVNRFLAGVLPSKHDANVSLGSCQAMPWFTRVRTFARPVMIRRLFQVRLSTLLLVMTIVSFALRTGMDRLRSHHELAGGRDESTSRHIRYDVTFGDNYTSHHFGSPVTIQRHSSVWNWGWRLAASSILNEPYRPVASLQIDGREPCATYIVRSLSEAMAFSTNDPSPEMVAAAARLGELQVLRINGVTKETDLAPFSCTTQLKQLQLGGESITGNALRYFANNRSLEWIDLHNLPISDDNLVHLAGLTELKQLRLGGTAVTGKGLAHLKRLNRLELLDLIVCELVDVDELNHLPPLPALKCFITDRLTLPGKMIKTFTRCPALTRWCLTFSDATDEDIAELAKIPQIEYLSLANFQGTDQALTAISELKSVVSLSIDSGTVSLAGLRALASSPCLRCLYLFDITLGADEMQAIAEIPGLTNLGLKGCSVDDRDLRALINHRSLQSLDLHNTLATDAGIVHLCTIPNLRSFCPSNYTSNVGVRMLAKGRQNLRVNK